MGRRRRRRRETQHEQREALHDVADCHIAIVGAGLCGLAVALALEQRLVDRDNADDPDPDPDPEEHDPAADQDEEGVNGTATTTTRNHHRGSITIYERDESLAQQREGYGLTLSYRPGGTLDRLGLLDALTDHDCPSRAHYILRGDGRFIGYYGHNLTGTGYGQRGNIRVPRRQARQVLFDRLRRTKICWGHRLVSLEEEEEEDDNGTSTMKLSFANGYSTVADLVIAADGIRSDVVRLQYPTLPPPRPLDVRIILGLTRPDTSNLPISPLLCERGFYTLEPGRRLFVMPYQGSALGHSFDPTEPVRYMWQLSFREDTSSFTSSSSSTTSSSSPDDLLREAQDRTAGWHDPVPWLLQHTDVNHIWGTHLHDRDPTHFAITRTNETTTCRRVIVAGDALHAMSPFKGQGANQSLQDALTIAKWISGGGGGGEGDGPKLRYSVAVANCQRELVQRTAPMVQASREAARYWHTDAAAATATHAWAGVTDPTPLVAALAAQTDLWHANDTTLLLTDIDTAVRNLVAELNLDVTVPVKPPPSPVLVQAAHAAAHAGCLRTLRRLSFECKESVRSSDCLKIAARAGHLRVVHWLIKEGGCSCCPAVDFDDDDEDSIGNPVRALMARLCPNMIRPKETNAKPSGVLVRTVEGQSGKQTHLISTHAVST